MMIVAMLAIGAMLLAACGGDDDDDEDPTAPPATEAPADESPTPAAEESPAASPVGPGASPVASPGASPVASPVGSPAASPVAPVTEDDATPVGSPPAAPAASPAASPVASGAVTVDMVDIAFEPTEFEIPAGTDVEVTLTNSGAAIHDFTIDALGIAEVVDPGAETTITINAEAGTYDYICTQPGHLEAGMAGVMTVA